MATPPSGAERDYAAAMRQLDQLAQQGEKELQTTRQNLDRHFQETSAQITALAEESLQGQLEEQKALEESQKLQKARLANQQALFQQFLAAEKERQKSREAALQSALEAQKEGYKKEIERMEKEIETKEGSPQ